MATIITDNKSITNLKYSTFHKDLITDIDALGFSNIRKNQAYCLINLLIWKGMHPKQGFTPSPSGWSQLSQTYLIAGLTAKYPEVLNPLIKANIIKRDKSYQVSTSDREGYSKSYCVSPKYFIGDANNYKSIEVNITKFKDKTLESDAEQTKWINDFRKTLVINRTNLIAKGFDIIESKLANIVNKSENIESVLSKLYCESVIPVIYWRPNIKFEKATPYRYKVETLLKTSVDKNLDIFMYNDKVYLGDLNVFIRSKRSELIFTTQNSIDRLCDDTWIATRNETNNRLDYPLTNAPKELVEIIKRENNLSELDLSNSQFCFMSTWLRSQGVNNTNKFSEITENGSIYNIVAKKMGNDSTRDDGKSKMFLMLFGPIRGGIISDMFPEIDAVVNNYKEEYGYQKFSVMLQNMESDVFIDKILKSLQDISIPAITKHDSIIVNESHCKIIESFANSILKENDVRGTLKIS